MNVNDLLTREFKTIDPKDVEVWKVREDRILIRMYPKEDVSDGGIKLPDASQTPRASAWVIGVSDEAVEKGYEIGDTVMASLSGLAKISEIHKDVFIMRLEDVFLHAKGDADVS